MINLTQATLFWLIRMPLVWFLMLFQGILLALLWTGQIDIATWQDTLRSGTEFFMLIGIPFLFKGLFHGERSSLLISRPLSRNACLIGIWLACVLGYAVLLALNTLLGSPVVGPVGTVQTSLKMGVMLLYVAVYLAWILLGWIHLQHVYATMAFALLLSTLVSSYARLATSSKGMRILEYILPPFSDLSYAFRSEALSFNASLLLAVTCSTLVGLGLAIWQFKKADI